MLDQATVHLESETLHNAKVKFKDNGWIGVRQPQSPWQYYPPRRIESVKSQKTKVETFD